MLYQKNHIVNCKFQNSLKNFVPNGLDLLPNKATTYELKEGRQSNLFTGSYHIDVPINLINGKLNDGFTICTWIYPTNLTAKRYQEIFRKEDGATARILFAFQETGTLLAFGLNKGGYNEIDFPIDKVDYENKWVHLVFSFNNITGERKMYKNGIKMYEDVLTGTFNYGGNAIGCIGNSRSASEHFVGNMYDFQIFNKGLIEEDVKRVMMGLQPL